MPCFKRNKRSRSGKSGDSSKEDNGNGRLHNVLQRVSFLSSTIVKFLRDIRVEIMRLFGLQELLKEENENKTNNERGKIMSQIYCKENLNMIKQNLASGDSPRKRREHFKQAARYGLEYEFNNEVCSNKKESSSKIDTYYDVSDENDGLYATCKSKNFECESVQKESMDMHINVDKLKNDIWENDCEESHDGISCDYRLETLLAQAYVTGRTVCNEIPSQIQDHSLEYIVIHVADQNGLVTIQKSIKINENKVLDKTPEVNLNIQTKSVKSVTGTPPPNPQKTDVNEQQISDHVDSEPSKNITHVSQEVVLDSPIEIQQQTCPTTTYSDESNSSTSKTENKRLSCKPVSQTTNHTIGPGASVPQNLPNTQSSNFAGARPKTGIRQSSVPREIPEERKPAKENIRKRIGKFFKKDSTKKRSAERGDVSEQTQDTNDEATQQVQQQSMEFRINEQWQLRVNQDQLNSIMHIVVKHCIVTFPEHCYRMHMLLEVRITAELNRPRYEYGAAVDGLPENATAVPTVRFHSRFNLEGHVNNPAEQLNLIDLLHAVLPETNVDWPDGSTGPVTADNELFWCLKTLHFMMYICYYVFGRYSILERIHNYDSDERHRISLVKALHNHVIQKFEGTAMGLVPHMRHAVENFTVVLDQEVQDAGYQSQTNDEHSEKPVQTKKKKKNRSARRANSRYRNSLEVASTSKDTSQCDAVINEENKDVADYRSDLISYNADISVVDCSQEVGDKRKERKPPNDNVEDVTAEDSDGVECAYEGGREPSSYNAERVGKDTAEDSDGVECAYEGGREPSNYNAERVGKDTAEGSDGVECACEGDREPPNDDVEIVDDDIVEESDSVECAYEGVRDPSTYDVEKVDEDTLEETDSFDGAYALDIAGTTSSVNDMQYMLAADISRELEWDFADYITYIETNNTLDYSCLEVVAGHGETPNKKKICGEIKKKIKTKGIPNKHLEKTRPTDEIYDAFDDLMDETDDVSDTANDPKVTEEIWTMIEEGDSSPQKEKEQDFVMELPEQTIDDREYNFVPEEVLRKDESKLKDLEEAYFIGSAEKRKDTQKKKKEKRPKAVKKLYLDIKYADTKHYHYRR